MPPRFDPLTIADAFDELRNDYRAGKDSRFQSRLTGVDPMGSGADYHYRSEAQWLHMMERARFYQRNDPVVSQGIKRVVSNIVQKGFGLDVNTGDKSIDAELKARWDDWSTDPEQCHSERELSFWQMERLTLSHTIVDGDILFLPLTDGSLHTVEAHRCRTPRNTTRNVVHGIYLTGRAVRDEYWLTKQDLDPNKPLHRVGDIRKVPARDAAGHRQVFHVYDPYRTSQRRGVTAIAPIADVVGIHDDTQFATLVKQQMAAMIAILHERDTDFVQHGKQRLGPQTTEELDGFTRQIEGVSAGLEVFGAPGETLSAFSPQIPGPGYLEHTMLLLTFIAINLDLPVHVLLLDPSRTNFSGWRGAIEQARMRFSEIQKLLHQKFHEPVYRWKVRQWMQQDVNLEAASKRDGISIFGHQWNPPTWAYLEPLTDASADLLQQRNGLNSSRRIQANRGREWDIVAREIVEDNSLAIRLALAEAQKINADFQGAGVHWRELISLPTPDGVNVSVTSEGFAKISEANEEAETATNA